MTEEKSPVDGNGAEASSNASGDGNGTVAPKKKMGSTALRLASALPLIPLVLWLMFAAPKWAFQLFGFVWIAIVASELMKMTIPESAKSRAWGILATLGLTAVMFYAPEGPILIVAMFGLVIGALVFGLLSPKPVPDASRRLGWLLGGPIYIGGTLGTVGLLHDRAHGGAWVLLAMFAAFLSDTGAYFAGRAFGKHKLYPLVSPKKTIEGSIGGLITAAGGAVAVQQIWLAEMPTWHAAVLGVVAAALGQGGDLLESLIKRSCGVKDSGNIMPGHGGLLDRSDALMFTAAATWVYVTFFLPA